MSVEQMSVEKGTTGQAKICVSRGTWIIDIIVLVELRTKRSVCRSDDNDAGVIARTRAATRSRHLKTMYQSIRFIQ